LGQASQTYTGKTEPVKWVRIHTPDFVYFNHAQHVTVAGIECQTCHGPETYEIQKQFAPLTMGWCINCHRKKKWKWRVTSITLKNEELSKKYGVDKLTAQMGGLECGNATINQIIKFLIFIYNVIKQKILEKCWGTRMVLLLRRLEITNLLKLYLLRTS
jgi:hypothetical protein